MPFFLNFLGVSVEAAPSAVAGFLTTFLTGLGSDEPSAALGAATFFSAAGLGAAGFLVTPDAAATCATTEVFLGAAFFSAAGAALGAGRCS